MSYVSVDVDIDEILCSMCDRERQELVDELYNDGYIPTKLQNKYNNYADVFSNACEKLKGQAWRLTREEEEFIINVSKRF
jgi:hypothetical protein